LGVYGVRAVRPINGFFTPKGNRAMAKAHSFSPDIASKVGINAAVILYNLEYWVDKNKANDKHFYDGYYWSYNSIKAFSVLFNYLTEKQIRTALDKLVSEGYLIKGKYNKKGYDRTTWYTVTTLEHAQKAICPTGQVELPCRADAFAPEGEPIPDSKPDNKPNTKQETEWPSYITKEIELEIKSLRKAAKAPLTPRSKKMLINQLDLAIQSGYTIDQCMDVWSMSGWRSFQADWMKNKVAPLHIDQQQIKARSAYEAPKKQSQEVINGLKGLKA
jgi:hypothetical protein